MSTRGAVRTDGRPRKAIFPLAGYAPEFLPATKACPKEMLPIVDRPLIQYAVEEAAAAGVRDMIFVTGRGKRAIEDHFDTAYELEREMLARDDAAALIALRSAMPAGVSFSCVRQRDDAGVVDALLRARALAADEPFAVLLPDDLIDGERPALVELVEMFLEERASVVGVAPPMPRDASTAAAVVVDEIDGSVRRVVERRSAAHAHVDLVGRCIFTPQAWPALARAARGRSLGDAVAALLGIERVVACRIHGQRYDCSTKLGWLEAQLAYARKRADLWPQLRDHLEQMVDATPRHAQRPPRAHGAVRPALG